MPTPVGKIIITLASKELSFDFEPLGLNFNSTDKEIMDAIKPLVLEQEGFDLSADQDEGAFTLKRVEESGNIFCFPKSVAGFS